ncbi:MAG: tetratricopeptide repeat protein [Verrucomicrobia bacterium]|nr:tetratricopeptide repeat protein [Verrucomicrobiota bacterium]
MKDCLLLFALIHCLFAATLNGQVETMTPAQPEVIIVNTTQLDGFQNLEAGNFDLAIEQFDQLLEQRPNYVSALMGKAKSLFQLSEYQEAYDTYSKVLEIHASDVHSLEGLGNSALFLGQTDLALTHFKKALNLKPDNGKIYHAIAVSQICKNDYLNAAESAKMASLMFNKQGIEAPYSLILAYFSYAQIDDKENMQQVLTYSKNLNVADRWPSSIIQFIKGDIKTSELISRVQSEKEEIEAHTYVGLKLKYEEQFQASEMHLNWVENFEKTDVLESLIAKHILKHSRESISHAFNY